MHKGITSTGNLTANVLDLVFMQQLTQSKNDMCSEDIGP